MIIVDPETNDEAMQPSCILSRTGATRKTEAWKWGKKKGCVLIHRKQSNKTRCARRGNERRNKANRGLRDRK